LFCCTPRPVPLPLPFAEPFPVAPLSANFLECELFDFSFDPFSGTRVLSSFSETFPPAFFCPLFRLSTFLLAHGKNLLAEIIFPSSKNPFFFFPLLFHVKTSALPVGGFTTPTAVFPFVVFRYCAPLLAGELGGLTFPFPPFFPLVFFEGVACCFSPLTSFFFFFSVLCKFGPRKLFLSKTTRRWPCPRKSFLPPYPPFFFWGVSVL